MKFDILWWSTPSKTLPSWENVILVSKKLNRQEFPDEVSSLMQGSTHVINIIIHLIQSASQITFVKNSCLRLLLIMIPRFDLIRIFNILMIKFDGRRVGDIFPTFDHSIPALYNIEVQFELLSPFLDLLQWVFY